MREYFDELYISQLLDFPIQETDHILAKRVSGRSKIWPLSTSHAERGKNLQLLVVLCWLQSDRPQRSPGNEGLYILTMAFIGRSSPGGTGKTNGYLACLC